jgi:hypothetical protein
MFANSQFQAQLADELASGSPSYSHRNASVAWNLLNDWRVNHARFQQFDAFAAGLPPAPSVVGEHGLLSKYYEANIRKACPANGRNCDFVEAENDYNRYGVPTGVDAINPSRLVSTVISLSNYGLKQLYEAPFGIEPEFDYSTSFPISKARGSVNDWLDAKLRPALREGAIANPASNAFLIAVARQLSLAMSSPRFDHEPVWVTYTRELKDLAGNDPHRWRSLVGVINDPVNHPWLLVLTYRLSHVGDRLYRPTQLESGFNPLHFPPPPTNLHGLAMDTEHTRSHRPLPEFIHGRIDHGPSLADPAQSPIRHCIRLTASTVESSLPHAQRNHLHLLKTKFPATPTWPVPDHPAHAHP